jgi:NAD(P)-dependent dehydrogenase (short-subunit alcohol dehydrogenase family)
VDDVLGYEGQRVVVCGAATGMGNATVRLLLDLGAHVTALDVKSIDAPVHEALEIDLRDAASIDQAVAAIEGPLLAVFSCAGLPGPPFSDVDVMLVNFVGNRYFCESLVPKLGNNGAIATIASTAGAGWEQQLDTLIPLVSTDGFETGKQWCEQHPELIAGGYAPSKQAMNTWVAWRSATLIGRGVRLNVLNPGPTETPLMPNFEQQAGGAKNLDFFTRPINRRSQPEEQAWAMVVLNSPRLSYLNGHAFNVDGGFTGALLTGQIDFAEFGQ